MRNRKPASVGAETFNGPEGGDRALKNESFGATLLWAPYERQGSYAGILFTGLFMELLGTLVFTFFTVMVASKTGSVVAMDPTLNGFLIAIVSAGTYFMAAGGWRVNTSPGVNELPRHLSLSVTFANFLVLRTGFLILILYWTAQVLGALCGGGLLLAFLSGPNALLPLATSAPIFWGAEIFGAGVICLVLLYNQYFGGSYQEEVDSRKNAVLNASLARFALMVVFFPLGTYYFDGVLYIAAVIGTCVGATCTNGLPMPGAPAFYTLVPLLGAAAAALVYYFLLAVGYVSRPGGSFARRPVVPSRNNQAVQGNIATSSRSNNTVAGQVGISIEMPSMGLPKMN